MDLQCGRMFFDQGAIKFIRESSSLSYKQKKIGPDGSGQAGYQISVPLTSVVPPVLEGGGASASRATLRNYLKDIMMKRVN